MLIETTDYAKSCRDFRCNIPARFSLATACCTGPAEADGDFTFTLDQGPEDGQPQ
jgi:acetyl-CoA synthetase